MPRNHIDTVTLDLWFTLIAHDEFYDDRIIDARKRGIARVLKDAGYRVPVERIAAAYDNSATVLEERWATNLDVDTDEQVKILLKCMGIEPEPALIKAVAVPYADAVLEVEPFLVDGVRETLDELKGRGLRLALISNTGRTPGQAMRKVIDRMGILDYFEVTTFSNEAGYLKPHPKIFEMTLARIGTKPESTVHVGDHDVLDVLGAKGYGMKSIRVLQYAHNKAAVCEPDICINTMAELPDAISRLMI